MNMLDSMHNERHLRGLLYVGCLMHLCFSEKVIFSSAIVEAFSDIAEEVPAIPMGTFCRNPLDLTVPTVEEYQNQLAAAGARVNNYFVKETPPIAPQRDLLFKTDGIYQNESATVSVGKQVPASTVTSFSGTYTIDNKVNEMQAARGGTLTITQDGQGNVTTISGGPKITADTRDLLMNKLSMAQSAGYTIKLAPGIHAAETPVRSWFISADKCKLANLPLGSEAIVDANNNLMAIVSPGSTWSKTTAQSFSTWMDNNSKLVFWTIRVTEGGTVAASAVLACLPTGDISGCFKQNFLDPAVAVLEPILDPIFGVIEPLVRHFFPKPQESQTDVDYATLAQLTGCNFQLGEVTNCATQYLISLANIAQSSILGTLIQNTCNSNQYTTPDAFWTSGVLSALENQPGIMSVPFQGVSACFNATDAEVQSDTASMLFLLMSWYTDYVNTNSGNNN